ncbi:hypothetical protein TNCV_342421 [Trichonephila clavipes]|nr:hypothetical protein TNCV_342421 [Trichonephila clavipes]
MKVGFCFKKAFQITKLQRRLRKNLREFTQKWDIMGSIHKQRALRSFADDDDVSMTGPNQIIPWVQMTPDLSCTTDLIMYASYYLSLYQPYTLDYSL